ncbi:MAG: hypothetical protein WDM96_03335 [Lacunisphaera sp.]
MGTLDVVVGQFVDAVDAAVHDGADGLAGLVRVIQAEGVAQLVQDDPPDVEHVVPEGAAVGVPSQAALEEGIGLGSFVAAAVAGGDRQRGVAKILAVNRGGKRQLVARIVVGRRAGGLRGGLKLGGADPAVPIGEGGEGAGVVVRAVAQRLVAAQHDYDGHGTRRPLDGQAGVVIQDEREAPADRADRAPDQGRQDTPAAVTVVFQGRESPVAFAECDRGSPRAS